MYVSRDRVGVGMRPKTNSWKTRGLMNGGGREGNKRKRGRTKRNTRKVKVGRKFLRTGDEIQCQRQNRCRRQRMVMGSEARNREALAGTGWLTPAVRMWQEPMAIGGQRLIG